MWLHTSLSELRDNGRRGDAVSPSEERADGRSRKCGQVFSP